MDLAHVHLILNHVPMIGLPIALVFLTYGLIKGQHAMERLSLIMIGLLAFVVLPIFLTGEPAEDMLKQVPGIENIMPFVHPHEDAATISLVLTLVTAISAFIVVIFEAKIARLKRKATLCVYLFSLISIFSLFYTASLGGQIRHTELRPEKILTPTE